MQKPSKALSRRAFLAATGGALAVWALPQALPRTRAASRSLTIPASSTQLDQAEWEFIQPRPARLDLWGRLTDFGTSVREAAGGDAKVIGFLPINTVLPLFEIVHAPGPANNPHNDVWYRFEGGYLYTANVQVIRPYRMPVEVAEIDTQIDDLPGFWAEVIVPFTLARVAPGSGAFLNENGETVTLTYASVHRIVKVEPDTGGYLWYKVDDDKKGAKSFYVLARHLRRLAPEELTPTNTGANKRIVITLADQRMDCYEDDRVVFSTLVSSGASGFNTPKGDHAVVYKQISRHMYSDPEQEAFSDPNFFDLPGVPFNTFFTTMGHAIHGTYWHGDFGRPRSHGCVNVTPEAARWVWRWAEPVSGYSSLANGSSAEPGTPVTVV